jgi:hypothetical protein
VIDALLALDPGGRGIARFFVPGGAVRAARALCGARRVLVTTGFCLGPGLPETDGPPGAAALGRALRRLGAAVRYVTDPAAVPPLAAALAELGEPAAVETFHAAHADGRAAARRLLAEHRPSHLVAIERPGRTRDGDYRSARGESVKAWNGPLDALLLAAGRGVVTVAVGDGGNEAGMGAVARRIPPVRRADGRRVPIASTVPARHLVVAGTSNWGAYGVVAALGALAGRPLLHDADEERRMVAACVRAGAVDGITRRAEPTVDGLPMEVHVGILELLRLAGRPAPGSGAARPGRGRPAPTDQRRPAPARATRGATR